MNVHDEWDVMDRNVDDIVDEEDNVNRHVVVDDVNMDMDVDMCHYVVDKVVMDVVMVVMT